MGILYRNRTLVGNISLVVFVAFLLGITFGAIGPQAAQAQPNTLEVKDKQGDFVSDGTVNVQASDSKTVPLEIKISPVTPAEFDILVLKFMDANDNVMNQVYAKDITNVTYEAYNGVAGTYVYTLVYNWVYNNGFNFPLDVKLAVYQNSDKLTSVVLNIEGPPPEGGGGGAPADTDTTVDTGSGTITVDADTGTATFTPDYNAIDNAVSDVNVTAVVFEIPQVEQTAGVTRAIVPVKADKLSAIAAAGKSTEIAMGNARVTAPPEAVREIIQQLEDLGVDLAKASLSFDINTEATPREATGAGYKAAGAAVNLNLRVTVDGEDKGGINDFRRPVSISIAYNAGAVAGKWNLLASAGDAGLLVAAAIGVDEDKLGVYRYNEAAGKWEYVGGKVDKVNKKVIVALTKPGKYAVFEYDKTFADLAGHWSRRDVEIMAARHVVRGMTEENFVPNSNVTRAQFAAMVLRSLGLEEAAVAGDTFKDVKAGAWYAGAVEAAYKAGIVSGYEDGTFRPGENITRQEMAAMVTRALSYSGKSVSLTRAEADAILGAYADSAGIAAWAKKSAAVAVKEGIVTGRSTGTYAPAANATRAEGTVMLKRMMSTAGRL